MLVAERPWGFESLRPHRSMTFANLALRFLLELAALGSLAYWGFAEFDGVAQWLVGLGAPLLAATVWGRFVSPKASHPATDPERLLLELLVFGAGVAALAAAGEVVPAVVLAALVAVHLALTFVLDQRRAEATG